MEKKSTSSAPPTSLVEVQVLMDPQKLSSVLLQQIALLKETEANIQSAQTQFEKIRESVGKIHFDTDIIKLDVGGIVFKTSLETLRKRQEEGSLLASMFSGDGISVSADADGHYFIDRDGTNFRHILNYLRGNFNPKNITQLVKQELMEEANFYGLPSLMKLLSRNQFMYTSFNNRNGIINFLGQQAGAGLPGLVDMHSSSTAGNAKEMLFPNPSGAGDGGACSIKNNFFDFHFLKHYVVLSYYAFAHVSCQAPKDWIVSGSTDAVTWVPLHTAQNQNYANQRQGWAVTPQTTPFSWIRIQIIDSHGGAGCLHIRDLELWGELMEQEVVVHT